MILQNNNTKRMAIYFFYDKDGIVDEYICYMLDNLKEYIDELLIVCNGKLSKNGRDIFSQYTSNILVRENKGFDVWAYKEALEVYGWNRINKFDELILMNFTIMGPLYPFQEMFSEMNQRDVDFWGITTHHGAPFDPFNKIKYGFIPEHIQSHFIAVRKKMLISDEFRLYWQNRPKVNGYDEAISYHEAIFTREFEEKGFNWEVYIDTSDLKKHSYYPLIMSPLELVKNRRCPIIKKRSFFHEYADYLNFTNGDSASQLMKYIEQNLNYDVDMIWKNILRVNNQADIKRCLELNYILSSKSVQSNLHKTQEKEIALILHIYFKDLIQYCFEYAKSIPKNADVYITTDSEEKKEEILKIFSELECRKLEVIIIENRGRDVSALLVATKKFIMSYDYVCFAHDKKVGQLDLGIKGEAFSEKCFKNILGNKTFVENIINTFEQNPRLGLLTPPPPNHGDYYPTIGYFDWGNNFEQTKKLADKLKITVDMNYDKEPIAPLGTMFWFRPKAMKLLFNQDWEYTDFPKEPNDIDGTLLHAIERIYPFVVQQEGYYPAWVLIDDFAQVEMTNLYYMLREMNKSVFRVYGGNTHQGLIHTINYTYSMGQDSINSIKIATLLKIIIKRKAQQYLPHGLYEAGVKVKRKIFNSKYL